MLFKSRTTINLCCSDVYRSKNMVKSFDEILDNVFTPLFEVSNDPETHPELFRFLQQVSGIDSVDDESKHEYVHVSLLTCNFKTDELLCGM